MSPENPPHEGFPDQAIPVRGGYAGNEGLDASDLDQIAQRLGSLVLDSETVLREHQQVAFEDIVNFYAQGGRETYVKLPTSTGKTVLFVEITRHLLESTPEDQPKPKVLVLVPNIDLVDQTVGSIDPQTGKKRGFKGFAPDLNVRGHHSHVSQKQRDKNLVEADVLVTTYNTFRNLVDSIGFDKSVTRESIEDGIASAETKLAQARAQVASQTNARNEFIRTAFTAQSIAHARKKAATLLRQDETEPQLAVSARAHLQRIIDITDTELSNIDKLELIKRDMTRSKTPRVANGIKYRQETRRLASYSRRASAQRAKIAKEQDIDIKDVPVLPIPPAYQRTVERLDYTDYENFCISFNENHRKDRHPGTMSLRSRDARITANRMENEIRQSRQQVHYFAGAVTRLDRDLMMWDNVKKFDFIIADEAHRSIGTETWEAIRQYAEEKAVPILGLTATDEYYDRSLEDYFEAKAHDLTQTEAIKKQIVNPVALFVHNTGLRFTNIGIDASGDYDRLTTSEMRFSHERNKLAVDYAAALTEAGYAGIMSAIPGAEGSHAKLLAGILKQKTVTDPLTGLERPIRAEYVLGTTEKMQKARRQQIYAAFEKGELDWLVFIDVLREGWDSDRAKALINTRPTRSPLLATQRLGRIGRTHEGAPISVLIDLFDGLETEASTEIPPVLGVDVFHLGEIAQGHIVGPDKDLNSPTLDKLRGMMVGLIEPHHSRFVRELEQAQVVDARGLVAGSRNKEDRDDDTERHWQTFDSIQRDYRGFMPKDILLEAVQAEPPLVNVTRGRRGHTLVPLFNTIDVGKLYADKPEVSPWKLYVDKDDRRWIAPEGIVQMLSRQLPGLQPAEIEPAVRGLEAETNQQLQKEIGRVRLYFGEGASRKTGLTRLYLLDEVRDLLAPKLLESFQAEQT